MIGPSEERHKFVGRMNWRSLGKGGRQGCHHHRLGAGIVLHKGVSVAPENITVSRHPGYLDGEND